MVSPKTAYRTKVVSATALAAASIGVLFLRFAKPKDEPIMYTERPHPTVPAPHEDCEPHKGDLLCEVRKGEADPLSRTFDPESCGFCGDGIRQVTAPAGSPPVLDMDSGITTQLVTERPSETPESCAVDFHCGNGRRDFRRTYGAWLETLADAGVRDGSYILGTKTITENSHNCPSDTRSSGNGGGDAGMEVVEDAEPPPAQQTTSAWNCPSMSMPTNSSDMVDMRSSSVWNALSRVYGAINTNAAALRRAIGASESARVDLRLNIRVEPRGYMSFNQVSAQCDNQPCGDSQSIINATGLSLNGLVMGAPETECYWTLTIHVPRA